MDLRVCQYYLTILEEGSMNKAAKNLGITQPTLSRQIAQLEEELGVALFERKAKSLHPTREGLLFAKRAQELLDIDQRTRTELLSISEGVEGVLTIGCGEYRSNRCFLRMVHEFIGHYPKVAVAMVTGNSDQIKEQIENGNIDIGLFLEPVDLSAYDTLVLPEKEQWVAILRGDHPLADRPSLSPQALAKEPLIFPYRKEPVKVLTDWFGKFASRLHIAGYSSLTSNGSLMVIEGFGTLLTLGNMPAFSQKNICQIPLDPPIYASVILGWKHRFPKSPLLETFIDFLDEKIKPCNSDSV